jgi:hypothetical protein
VGSTGNVLISVGGAMHVLFLLDGSNFQDARKVMAVVVVMMMIMMMMLLHVVLVWYPLHVFN